MKLAFLLLLLLLGRWAPALAAEPLPAATSGDCYPVLEEPGGSIQCVNDGCSNPPPGCTGSASYHTMSDGTRYYFCPNCSGQECKTILVVPPDLTEIWIQCSSMDCEESCDVSTTEQKCICT